MARRNKQPKVEQPKAEQPKAESNGEDKKRSVPVARRCPACWNGLSGVGKRRWQTQINGPLKKRGYACVKCGTTWQAEVRTHIDENGVEWITTEIGKVEPDDDFIPDEIKPPAFVEPGEITEQTAPGLSQQ